MATEALEQAAPPRERRSVTAEVAQALTIWGLDDTGGTGWRAGMLLENGGVVTGAAVAHSVEFGTCTGWEPCPSDHLAPSCRARRRSGRRVPVFAMDGGHERLGCEGFWTTELQMREWVDRQEGESGQ